MPFNSLGFLFIFLPVTLLVLNTLRKSNFNRLEVPVILGFSILFIYLNSSYALAVVAGSIVLNLLFFQLQKKNKNRLLLATGILLNLSVLVLYKILERSNSNVLVPIGLSYYAFQQIALLVNRYENDPAVTGLNIEGYIFNVLFFPKFLSGPILTEPVKAISSHVELPTTNLIRGLFVFSVGLAKKILIADALIGPYIKDGYASYTLANSVEAWSTVLLFLFHLYFDFSGYSDMAYGIAKMFNYQITWNFRAPFKAPSMIEFWKNWHASLSNFINVYFFNALIRVLPFRFTYQMFGIFLAMFMIGVWHGFDLKYAVFGALNGIILIINYIFRRYSKIQLYRPLSVALTFLAFAVTFAFFSAPNINYGVELFKQLLTFNFNSSVKNIPFANLLLPLGLILFCQTLPHTARLEKSFKPNLVFLLFCLANCVLSIVFLTNSSRFIYEGF